MWEKWRKVSRIEENPRTKRTKTWLWGVALAKGRVSSRSSRSVLEKSNRKTSRRGSLLCLPEKGRCVQGGVGHGEGHGVLRRPDIVQVCWLSRNILSYKYPRLDVCLSRLRTNGVNTNGAAAKVMNFNGLGEKSEPWHFWEDKAG